MDDAVLRSLIIVGCGRQGRRHCRIAAELNVARRIITVDPRDDRPPGSDHHVPRLVDALGMQGIDAAIVATPTALHAEFVQVLLEHGIPTLVEKPLANTVIEARTLVGLVESTRTPLFVGYVERFNPVVQLVKQIVASGAIGQPVSLVLRRLGTKPIRAPDMDVIHDLAVHDIDLIQYLYEAPRLLAASGKDTQTNANVHTAQLLLSSGESLAVVESSAMAALPVRTLSVMAEDVYLVADLLRQFVDVSAATGDIPGVAWADRIHPASSDQASRLFPVNREPLADQLVAFIGSLRGEPPAPLATASVGLVPSEIADAASFEISTRSSRGGHSSPVSFCELSANE